MNLTEHAQQELAKNILPHYIQLHVSLLSLILLPTYFLLRKDWLLMPDKGCWGGRHRLGSRRYTIVYTGLNLSFFFLIRLRPICSGLGLTPELLNPVDTAFNARQLVLALELRADYCFWF